MRILVIGAVAAGTSAAAKARRNDDDAEIVIYELDQDISYSGCGLPYYIGGDIEDINQITPRDSEFFKKKYNIDILINHRVQALHTDSKTIEVKDLTSGEKFVDHYDKLVIATGAKAFVPEVEGSENNNVFSLRNVVNARHIKNFVDQSHPKKALIVGTGFIAFEMAESLTNDGIEVTLMARKDKIAPNLDTDMANILENELKEKGVKVITENSLKSISKGSVTLKDDSVLETDMILMATGVHPNVELAEKAGIELGFKNAIKVNTAMETSVKDIYACGDCIETYNLITKKPSYKPLGSTANKTGRIAGDAMTGGKLRYRGNLGTGIFKVFDLAVGSTGLSEKDAKEAGFDVEVAHLSKSDKPSYYGGKRMTIKAVADKITGRLLGVQIIGYAGVDKRIDVFATLITYGATVDEIFHLDLSYAPPFSTPKDPVHYTGMILDNSINTNRKLICGCEVDMMLENNEEIQIIDARNEEEYNEDHLKTAVNMPHSEIRGDLNELDKDKITITYCENGTAGNAAQNILLNHGFKNVRNMSGGHEFYCDCKCQDKNKK